MNDFTVLNDLEAMKLESMKQCAESWHSVFALLLKHNPDFTSVKVNPNTGEQSVLTEIRRLQALEKPHKRSRRIKSAV